MSSRRLRIKAPARIISKSKETQYVEPPSPLASPLPSYSSIASPKTPLSRSMLSSPSPGAIHDSISQSSEDSIVFLQSPLTPTRPKTPLRRDSKSPSPSPFKLSLHDPFNENASSQDSIISHHSASGILKSGKGSEHEKRVDFILPIAEKSINNNSNEGALVSSYPHPSNNKDYYSFPGKSITNSTELLRQKLQKVPQPTSKYFSARKEYYSKKKHETKNTKTDLKDIKMLQFTFWNPPSKRTKKSKKSKDDSTEEDESMNDDTADDEDNEKVNDKKLKALKKEKENPSSEIKIKEEKDKEKEDIKKEKEKEEKEKSSKTKVGPRVKVGPDGSLILDEKSLTIETSESKRANEEIDNMEIVASSSIKPFKNKKSNRGEWNATDTVKFYKALSKCGSDFSLMTKFFPTRTRGELKSKFKREDRKNSQQITEALACQYFDVEDDEHSDEGLEGMNTEDSQESEVNA